MKGFFIVLEGPDGSGTSTHSKLLADTLIVEGKDVLLTCEPTDGPIGKFIREALSNGSMPTETLQLLFTADRSWHIEKVIRPALEAGKIVISDRYALSTILYGTALGLNTEWLTEMNNHFIQPDLQLIALPPFEVCAQRVNKRPSKDIMEENGLMKHVYAEYAKYSQSHATLPIIDTSKDKTVSQQEILSYVQQNCYK